MKLTKFRIKNYKSITDSGDCYFSEKLTILAGKNESGKTSILEALEDFHQDRTIRDEAKPIDGDGVPEVSVSFLLTPDDVSEIFTEVDISGSVSKDVTITLTKKSGSTTYSIDPESRKQLGLSGVYDSSKSR